MPEGFSLNVILWKQREYINVHPCLCEAFWFIYFCFYCLHSTKCSDSFISFLIHNININLMNNIVIILIQQLPFSLPLFFLFSSEVLESGIKSSFERVVFQDAVMLYLYCNFASHGISLCFTAVKILKALLIRDKKFLQGRPFLFVFQAFASSLLKYKSFLSLRLESSISWHIRQFFRVGFFYFVSSESSILKLFILRARKFRLPKYKKNLF